MSRPLYSIVDLYAFLAQDEEWVAASAAWLAAKDGAIQGDGASLIKLADAPERYLAAVYAACDHWVRG